jgi:hypothetical protein
VVNGVLQYGDSDGGGGDAPLSHAAVTVSSMTTVCTMCALAILFANLN